MKARIVIALLFGIIFAGNAFSILRALQVQDAALAVALAVLAGFNFGFAACTAIVILTRRDDS